MAIRKHRFIFALIILWIGLSFIVYGLMSWLTEPEVITLTDEEIIQRGKELGLIDLKEYLNENQENTQNESTP